MHCTCWVSHRQSRPGHTSHTADALVQLGVRGTEMARPEVVRLHVREDALLVCLHDPRQCIAGVQLPQCIAPAMMSYKAMKHTPTFCHWQHTAVAACLAVHSATTSLHAMVST